MLGHLPELCSRPCSRLQASANDRAPAVLGEAAAQLLQVPSPATHGHGISSQTVQQQAPWSGGDSELPTLRVILTEVHCPTPLLLQVPGVRVVHIVGDWNRTAWKCATTTLGLLGFRAEGL